MIRPPSGFANFEDSDIERSLFVKATTTAQIQAAPVRHGHDPDSGSDPAPSKDGKPGNDVQASSRTPASAVTVQ